MPDNKTVFITGTSRGIGKATVKVFAEKGWDVIAHARKQTVEFEDYLSETATRNNVSIKPVYFDMLDTAAMKDCIRKLKKDKTIINALVNNAGTAKFGLLQMLPVSTIKDVFNINLFSHMELTQLMLKIMDKKNAAIVNVASVAGIYFRAGNSAYGVSKAALIAWTKVLQAELQGKVRVNAVAPGLTDTDMGNEILDKNKTFISDHSMFKRFAEPEEIAKSIYFLASDDASFITGDILVADSGTSV